MKKLLQLEVEFPDNFMSPETFDDPAKNKDFNTNSYSFSVIFT